LARFNFSQPAIEALLLAYPIGRGTEEHVTSRRITALKAVAARQNKPRGAKEDECASPGKAAEVVDGAGLLHQLETFFSRFLVVSSGVPLVLALWTLGTWTFDLFKSEKPDIFDGFPFLVVSSPVKRCGKTRLGELLALFAARAQPTVAPTEAGIFRVIEEERPTMILDEAEALRGKSERAEAVRAILNAGNRRGVTVPRCVGDSHKLRRFRVYSPKVIIAIGMVPDTIRDRSIVIPMQRKRPGEHVARFKLRITEPEAVALKKLIVTLVKRQTPLVETAYESLNLEFLEDREAECWEPMFAILKVVDPSRIEELRKTAERLSSEKAEADVDDSLSLRLLADIRSVWPSDSPKTASSALLERLRTLEESPWSGELDLTPRKLARMLKAFGISSRQIRLGDSTAKGYLREEVASALTRYLPSEVKHPKQAAKNVPADAFRNPKQKGDVSDAKTGSEPHKHRIVSDVSLENPAEEATRDSTALIAEVQRRGRYPCPSCGASCQSEAAAFFHARIFCQRDGASAEVSQ
jgi:hypothetical protein